MIKKKASLAIIGIGARLPGEINHANGFWQALIKGKNCITDVPEDRWNINKFYDSLSLLNSKYIRDMIY